MAIATLWTATAQAAAPRTATTFLKDRREVSAGTRAYSIGFEDGGFYANGWHITGEMGGIWAPPLKLADGIWFGVNGQWAGPATKFTSGPGYTQYDLPPIDGIGLTRTDYVPDGRRAAVFGLDAEQPGRRGQDGDGQGRRPLRAAQRLPVGRQHRPPDRGRQRQGHRRLPERRHARLQRRRQARLRARRPARERRPDRRRRLPRPAARARSATTATPRRRPRATTARSARARAASSTYTRQGARSAPTSGSGSRSRPPSPTSTRRSSTRSPAGRRR